MAPERVVVAMSGGVDSSVAAAQLHARGFEVVGVTLHLWDYPDDGSVRGRCCAPEDVHDARRVADRLGFAHYALDRREVFQKEVIQPFVEGYLSGETPSPCVSCNRSVKMRELLALADRFDAAAVATGHYARIESFEGVPWLFRAHDSSKDQSYFLHMLGESELARLRFPLGELDKAQVRQQALDLQLPGASKGESQELCFVPTGRYDQFVTERAEGRVRPGPMLDEAGRVVGEHTGIHGFTVGQRRNLGVALGRRLYVLRVDAETNTVHLGPRERLLTRSARVVQPSWRAGAAPERCQVQVRYRAKPVGVRLRPTLDGLELELEEAVPAVVPGQYAFFYDGDRVLGGGSLHSLPSAVSAGAEPSAAEAV